MAFTSAADIKKLGFNAGFWGIDDETKITGDKTALDEFLEGYIWEAEQRLTDWVGAENYAAAGGENANQAMKKKITRAELCLALVEILPEAWRRAGTGEQSISFDGMSISMARASNDEQDLTIQNLLAKAERLVEPWNGSVDFGGIAAV